MASARRPFEDTYECSMVYLGTPAEVRVAQDKRRKATRYIASAAKSAEDCAHLLELLGLSAAEGKEKNEKEGT